jgi:hypothetical protein
MRKPTSPELRFWASVDKTATCWLWKKPGEDGYGRFFMGGRHHQAHRVSYGWEHGEVPAHLVVDHLCRVHACVRPSHLEAVTQVENMRRAVRKPRGWEPGTKDPVAKPKHNTGSRPRYCRACLKPASECEDIVKRVCAPCREEHKAKAMAALNARMGGR